MNEFLILWCGDLRILFCHYEVVIEVRSTAARSGGTVVSDLLLFIVCEPWGVEFYGFHRSNVFERQRPEAEVVPKFLGLF
jgi:hypothetical protein